jgi:hypothetical protein
MSWDIYIQDFPQTATRVSDIPNDFQPNALGKRTELIAKIHDVVPSADFSNPEWGIFEGDGYSIEFVMGSSEVCTGISLFVRGGGSPASLIAALLERLKLRGIDCQTSQFFDVEAAKASYGQWQQYRDRVIEKSQGNDDETKDESR